MIDLIEIMKYIKLINSHTLSLIFCYTQASRLSNSRLGIFPITLVFSSPCSRSTVLAYISLIRSFFCPGISQTLRSHHTTLILSLSPRSSFHTNIMYFHSSMVTTTTDNTAWIARTNILSASTLSRCIVLTSLQLLGTMSLDFRR